MIYRNWAEYQDAVRAYKKAVAEHEAKLEAWKKLFEEENLKGESETPAGCGCLTLVAAIVIAVMSSATVSDEIVGWLFAAGLANFIAMSLSDKMVSSKKRRLERQNPRPVFNLFEPEYLPPEEASPPPPPKKKGSRTVAQCFAILGLSETATFDQIKTAYRAKIREYHPDKVAHLAAELRELAEERSKEINMAYQLLEQRQGGQG